jgi:hypothetical protein
MLRRMSSHLQSRRLYIADLTRRQFEMEAGRVTMQPLAYRVVSKCLREALAGLPEPVAHAGFAELPPYLMPLLADVIEARHFDQHRKLLGSGSGTCRDEADSLIERIKRSGAG